MTYPVQKRGDEIACAFSLLWPVGIMSSTGRCYLFGTASTERRCKRMLPSFSMIDFVVITHCQKCKAGQVYVEAHVFRIHNVRMFICSAGA